MARRANVSGTTKISHAQAEDAGTTTSITALAATSGKIPHLHGVIVSTDTAGTYSVKIGSTTILKFYLAANSGYTAILHPYYFDRETANEAITVAKPSAANTSVTIFYSLETSL